MIECFDVTDDMRDSFPRLSMRYCEGEGPFLLVQSFREDSSLVFGISRHKTFAGARLALGLRRAKDFADCVRLVQLYGRDDFWPALFEVWRVSEDFGIDNGEGVSVIDQ